MESKVSSFLIFLFNHNNVYTQKAEPLWHPPGITPYILSQIAIGQHPLKLTSRGADESLLLLSFPLPE